LPEKLEAAEMFTLKNWSPAKQLSEDAAYGSDIDCLSIVPTLRDEQFGRSIPPSHHILCDVIDIFEGAREIQIPDLQGAVLVDKQVVWLEIPVNDLRRVHIVDSEEDLGHEVLDMIIGEHLLFDDNKAASTCLELITFSRSDCMSSNTR